jgi:hypothetical protein
VRDEDPATAGFVVLVGLFAIGLLILFAFFVAHVIGGWHAEAECRDRDGKVEHYDDNRPSLWRCSVPRLERAP